MYIKKGWNPVGEKLGDFASLGLFAGKSFKDKFGVTLQLRYEWVDRMSLNEVVRLHAYPNYDPDATGYKKVFLSPQLSYSKGKFIFYGLTDFPIYQYVNKTQVGTKHQSTIGISYKFFAPLKSAKDSTGYVCPMHPEEKGGKTSKCSICGMDLEKK
jgi:outer membrane receptor protein involved in Fe transport